MVLPIAASGRVESATCWTCCRTAACESGPLCCARAGCDANATTTSVAHAETTGRQFMVPSGVERPLGSTEERNGGAGNAPVARMRHGVPAFGSQLYGDGSMRRQPNERCTWQGSYGLRGAPRRAFV